MSLKSSSRQKAKRRNEPWVSNNRVLNSNAKKNGTLGRNPNFDTDETKLLIQLWGDPKVQRTLITTHKKHAVICQLANKMRDYGYYRSPEEITTRIKNMKCFYNRLKKEIELGHATFSTEPTWKHFAEMDAIMTRPIFSVRPNEVPAPSLKYQLEQAKAEREEDRQKSLSEDPTLSDSDNDVELDEISSQNMSSNSLHEIDDGIIPDVEVDIDINDETFAAITNAAADKSARESKRKDVRTIKSIAAISEYDDETDAEINPGGKDLHIKEEEEDSIDSNKRQEPTKPRINGEDEEHSLNTTVENNGFNEVNKLTAALVVPKEEPIDLDAEDDVGDDKISVEATSVTMLMPTLVDMLKMSHAQPAASQSVIAATTNGTTATITTANPTASTLAHGKISLVPTNFLLQPKVAATTVTNTVVSTCASAIPAHQQPSQHQKPQQIHLLPTSLNSQSTQLQASRILLSGGAQTVGVKNTGTTNTGIVAAGPGGMKVLLVNTDAGTKAAAVATNQLCASAGLTAQSLSSSNCPLGKTIGTVVPLNNTTTALIQQQQQQQQHQLQQLQQQLQEQQKKCAMEKEHQLQQRKTLMNEREKTRRDEQLMNKRDATTIRILLRQLLNTQTENNEIQQKRLKLERERLEFDKSTVERVLTALPTLFGQLQQQLQPALQQTQQQQQQHLLLQQAQSQHLTVPAMPQLVLNPPKLLFATTAAIPSATAGVNSLAATLVTHTLTPTATGTTTATTTLPKVIATPPAKTTDACKDIGGIQLLTPKVEKEE